MRYKKELKLILSEDNLSQPKRLIFTSDGADDAVDTTTLKDAQNFSKTYPIGTHIINVQQIANACWYYIKADKAVTLSIDSGSNRTLVADKPTESWEKFTAFTLITTEETRVTLAIAGD